MIDEKKLIMAIANWQQTLKPGWSPANDTDTVIYNTLEEVAGLIESQPTAYDVEAVVRELKAESELYSCEAEADMDNGWEYLSNRKYGISAGLQKAIEIARGGRNEK